MPLSRVYPGSPGTVSPCVGIFNERRRRIDRAGRSVIGSQEPGGAVCRRAPCLGSAHCPRSYLFFSIRPRFCLHRRYNLRPRSVSPLAVRSAPSSPVQIGSRSDSGPCVPALRHRRRDLARSSGPQFNGERTLPTRALFCRCAPESSSQRLCRSRIRPRSDWVACEFVILRQFSLR